MREVGRQTIRKGKQLGKCNVKESALGESVKEYVTSSAELKKNS